jgi:hypothetical protein
MKVADLLTEAKDLLNIVHDENAAKRLDYDAKTGRLGGTVKDWLAAMGVSDADVTSAVNKAKQSAQFKKMIDHDLEYVGTDKTEKNGVLRFKRPTGGFFEISANGQIRATDGGSSRSPVKSELPKVIEGNPVKTVLNLYAAGLKKIISVQTNSNALRKSINHRSNR